MSRPFIATSMPNGEYIEREMTDEEISEMENLVWPLMTDVPPLVHPE
jgi:hypothetical protein